MVGAPAAAAAADATSAAATVMTTSLCIRHLLALEAPNLAARRRGALAIGSQR